MQNNESDKIPHRRRALVAFSLMAVVIPVAFKLRFGFFQGLPFLLQQLTGYSLVELQKKLSSEEIQLVLEFRNDLLSHSFDDSDKLERWLKKKIDAEYKSLKLVIHKNCILSHTELALLAHDYTCGISQALELNMI